MIIAETHKEMAITIEFFTAFSETFISVMSYQNHYKPFFNFQCLRTIITAETRKGGETYADILEAMFWTSNKMKPYVFIV